MYWLHRRALSGTYCSEELRGAGVAFLPMSCNLPNSTEPGFLWGFLVGIHIVSGSFYEVRSQIYVSSHSCFVESGTGQYCLWCLGARISYSKDFGCISQ